MRMASIAFAVGLFALVPACTRTNPSYEVGDASARDLSGPQPDLIGADLAGLDFASTDFATADLLPPPSVLSIDDTSIAEGDFGISTMSFAVHLTPASAQAVQFSYATADGTAKLADGDYLSVVGVLTLPPGTTDTVIQVPVVADLRDEANETFTLTLSNPTNATLGDAMATGTIDDDDDAPTISISDSAGYEPTTPMNFRVALSDVSGRTVKVTYATADGTADDTRYTPKMATLTFTPGEVEKLVPITLINDAVAEAPETFFVTLMTPVNASVLVGTGTGTIYDDDGGVPVVSSVAAHVTEGDLGTTNMVFTLTLGAIALPGTYSVHVSTQPITATEGIDYDAVDMDVDLSLGTATVNVPVEGDTVYEGNETFALVISAPVGVTISTPMVTSTIVDDDTPPVFSMSDTDQIEGDVGATLIIVPITLVGDSEVEGSVQISTTDQTAVAPGDYATTTGLLRIPAGEAAWEVAVPIEGDTLVEGNETFAVNASMPVALTAGTMTAICTIDDDD
jgi:chitinase